MIMEILMFPGQGSQHSGMGKDLFSRNNPLCQQADDVLGYSISRLCLEDPEGNLNKTMYTQPALYFVSCLMYLEHVERAGDRYDFLIGHSLGLFPALFAAGVFDLMTGLEIVAKRGELMQSIIGGAMMAVIGEQTCRIDEKLVSNGFFDVDIANYNSPDQVVLSGKAERITQLMPLLDNEGYQYVPLPVNGAFHSRYMEPCRLQFVDFLMTQSLATPCKKVISSTSGEVLGAEHLLEEIGFQLVKPVRWSQTLQRLLRDYPQAEFRELGPGKVLTNLQTKIKCTMGL
ncbi:MAG: ACP S-malonyltransferase [Yersinia sp. (in: enterobacteria)]